MLTNFSPAKHKTYSALICPSPNSLILYKYRGTGYKFYTGALAQSTGSCIRSHTDTLVFVPVFQYDENPWERLPPCVHLSAAVDLARAGTTGHRCLSISPDGFREQTY